ncbi:MAG TPA: GNAT family N-acetyltransferase [Gemmatimonadaceae bacterium]
MRTSTCAPRHARLDTSAPTSAAIAIMEANITVRAACTSDAPRLARMRYDFRAQTHGAGEPPDAFVQRCAAWMAERLGDGSPWRCWVAERGDELVGAIWVQVVEKIPNPASEPEEHAYISNFYVPESGRGSGIGSMLLTTVLAWCDARPVESVILWPSARSRPLYERFGFTAGHGILERPGAHP